MTDVVVWLSCYVYIFAIWTYLTTVRQRLTIFFLKKNYISRGRSPQDDFKKNCKTIKKVEKTKIPTVNPLFNKLLYIHDKFVIGKWVNRCHFLIDEKKLQKFDLSQSQSQFLVLQLVQYWLIVVNFVLIVISNYVTIIKHC